MSTTAAPTLASPTPKQKAMTALEALLNSPDDSVRLEAAKAILVACGVPA